MAAKLQELEGRFLGERFRKGEFIIGQIEISDSFRSLTAKIGHRGDVIGIKGEADIDDLQNRQSYRFFGKFSDYHNRYTGQAEKQFEFQTFVAATSHDREGIIAYLENVGRGNGMGYGTARKAWERWGGDAVRTIRDDPGQLRLINERITQEQIDAIAFTLEMQRATEDATIECTNLLQGAGFPKATSRRAIKEWGNRAAEIIQRDPYRMMRFRGCGFKLCDGLWVKLGKNPLQLRRQMYAAWYAIKSDNNGHTWHSAERISQAVRGSVGVDGDPARAIKLGVRLARLSPSYPGGLAIQRTLGVDGPLLDSHVEGARVWIADAQRADQEQQLASAVAAMIHASRSNTLTYYRDGRPSERVTIPNVSLWPDPAKIANITDHQREKVGSAFAGQVAILGGSPGTGKTYTVAQVIRSILATGKIGVEDIAIGTPTGKAAVRMNEGLANADLPLRAATLHSLLGVAESSEGGDWGFLHGPANPWPYRLVVIDEVSMCDTALLYHVFGALPPGCHVLMVGDVHQLAPVGVGAPLRDMILSGVCGYGELTTIMRNSGGIVEACAAIRDGRKWGEGDNLKILEYATPGQQLEAVKRILAEMQGGATDPVWDSQVIVAMNDKGELSRQKINAELQSILNPNSKVDGTPFRIDDKIVCLQNGGYEDAEDREAKQYVANGELARAEEVQDKLVTARLLISQRLVKIPRTKQQDDAGESTGSGCNWDLAYGLTCHKMQGSETPLAIVVIDEKAMRLCDRAWIYTAISRAKSKCVIIGKKSVADMMCRQVNIGKRKTFLRELLQLENAKYSLECI
jgi:exodeoxyribonuclease V alpha subunit